MSSEVSQRLLLLAPLLNEERSRRLSFRTPKASGEIASLTASLGRYAVVNPGGRLDFRRMPKDAFIGAAAALSDEGIQPVITWGPNEEALAKSVAEAVHGARLAPATSIDDLAALMKGAVLTVCNNTGPMHLSVAVGAPTLAFFLRMDMARWGHAHPPHRMVDLTPVVEASGDVRAAAAEQTRRYLSELTRAASPLRPA